MRGGVGSTFTLNVPAMLGHGLPECGKQMKSITALEILLAVLGVLALVYQ